MQFQSDICASKIARPHILETTALGAACLAGITAGFWADREDLKKNRKPGSVFEPAMEAENREKLIKGWHKAVGRSQKWA
jgi:glycerol kinase